MAIDKNPFPTQLDPPQIFQLAFNQSIDRIRVDSNASVSITGDVTVDIDAATGDNIAIANSDGTKKVDVVTVSGVNALVVDLANSISSSVSGTVNTNLNGLMAFQTSQYTVGTSAVQLTVTPLTNRSSMSIKAVTTGTNIVYVGNSSGVTTSTGYALFDGDSLQLDLQPTQAVWVIASAAAQTVYVMEIG